VSDLNAPLHVLFEQQASRAPGLVAVACGRDVMHYAELDARSNQLAHLLQAKGVGPESLVGLFLDRSVDMVVAILGILKAGGAYVPVDTANPADRVAAILDDANVGVVVTNNSRASQMPGRATVRLDGDAADLAQRPATPLHAPLTGDNAAYVIYTSGSTGKPKGVVVTHANVVRLFTQTRQWFEFGPTDVWSLFHSIAFDFSVWELWGALLHGGKVVIVPQEITRTPDKFYELLRAECVTVLNQTPSAFRSLMPAALRAGKELPLRYVVFGGEALNLPSLKPWVALYGDDAPQLVNMYGITETTVHCTYRRIRNTDLDLGSVIGVPIPDLGFHLLDERQQPVPAGVAGEIYISGGGVARGYLNRPELTASRFLPDPFAQVPGGRMYRSGDSARRLSDGEVEYLGRLDTQVKIRGFRIELGEVEVAVREVPGVRDAVVVARDDAVQEKILVAYYTNGLGPADLTPTTFRAHLAARLPEHMVPARFVALEAIPLTINGKVDLRALPAPGRRRPALGVPMAAARTPVETWIAAHWAEVLDLDEVGVDDPFFELGGNSLAAMRLLASLSRDAAVALPALLLFRAATVGDMARLLERDYRDALPRSLVGVSAATSPAIATAESSTSQPSRERDELRARRMRRRHGG